MKDSRLIELLKTFNEDELKSFGKFLKSPLLKPPRNTIIFYDNLLKFFPHYDSPKLAKEVIYKKLFPGEKYNEKKLVNLMSALTKAAEDFLAYITLQKNEIEFLLSLSKGYLDKKLPKQSMRVNKLIETKLVPGFSVSKDYLSKFKRLTRLKSAYYAEFSDFENLIECKRKYFETTAVQFVIDYADIQSAKEPVQSTHGSSIENKFIESIFKCFDIEKLISLIEKNKCVHPLISLHYYLLKIKENPSDTEYYYSLRNLFYKNIAVMDREEKSVIFNFLLNYCIQKFNIIFIKESLEVYKKMLEHNAYSESENEYMQLMMYRNIVQTCITLKEIKWLEYFIENYTDALSPEYREDMKSLAYAYLYFMKMNFEKSLNSISKINHEVFLLKADVRNLLLKVYYELDDIERAYSLVDAYKHFLSSTNEISETNRKVFKNYLNFYFELLKIKTGQSKENPEFVKAKIEKENNLINKYWLLEKAEELG